MDIYSKGKITKNNALVSKVRYNREYLLSQSTAEDLNTYLSFSPFVVFNDMYAPVYKETGGGKGNKASYQEDFDSEKGPGSLGVRSIFNKSGAVMLGNMQGSDNEALKSGSSEWRLSNNVPLMDSPENRQRIKQASGCSVKELVQASREGLLGRETYDYSDFMYCKHLGRVPNNYLITLRRFPLPVDDYISTLGVEPDTRISSDITSKNSQSIGCLVTWLGTPGNDMNNILKYNYSMPFKFQNAQWQDMGEDADTSTGLLNGIAAAFDSTYRKQYELGQAGPAYDRFIGSMFGGGPNPYRPSTFQNWNDNNKVYGPVDAIKGTYMRGSDGLEFGQSFTLTFDYELRSYNGINGRQAFLDLLSNILNVTYTTGTFWGGGYRASGAHQNNIFSNLQIFKTHGGMNSYIDAFSKDYSVIKDKAVGSLSGKNPLQIIKSVINTIGGMLIAGQLNRLGRPNKVMINSLLSPAPVGFWHVTIGNPHHPIMSMGNMILKSTSIEHYGPLGLDDFPTGIRVTCELERGKPRDIRDIEKIYMHGNDRIYYSMGPKVFDMYKHAKEYKGGMEMSTADLDTEIGLSTSSAVNEPGGLNSVLKKYFGHNDTYSIYVSAAEQEYGAHKKPSAQSGPSSGDSRAK